MIYSCRNLTLTVPSLIKDDAIKTHTIIDNISLDIHQGMRVGLLGRNGSGKTTLLKLLSGRILPTSGTVKFPEDMRAIFSGNFGMDQRISGLENIYMQCLAMGMGLKQIETLIPDIIGFSMLEHDINKPMATYSAGMKLRLSVAISMTNINKHLVIDEWFGAGDKYFAKNLERRLNLIIEKTGTLLTTSHNLGLLKRICDTGIYLKDGKAMFIGPIEDAIKLYHDEK